MKKIIFTLLLLVGVFGLTGCAELVEQHRETVVLTVERTEYIPMRVLPVYYGKSIMTRIIPARYYTVVSYQGHEFASSSQSDYNKSLNRETVTGEITVRHFDDGTVSYSLYRILE